MKKPMPSMSMQSGVVLIVALIMLGIFSVIVVSVVNTSNINFKIAGNHQYRLEAKSAAQTAIESYISNPSNFQLPLPEANSYVDSDFNGDGVTDMTAIVAPPACIRSTPISMLELDIADPSDAQCTVGVFGNANSGIVASSGLGGNSNSWCNKMNWDVNSTVSDTKTGANIEMHQGIFLRAIIGTPCLENE